MQGFNQLRGEIREIEGEGVKRVDEVERMTRNDVEVNS
jgi:hypothetical protein